MTDNGSVQLLARLLFWALLVGILALTLLPFEPASLLPDDKANHFIGFLALAATGVLAWGRGRIVVVGIALILFGGAIELLQATPLVGRDADIKDWFADAAGVVAAVIVAMALMWRLARP